MGFLRTIQNLGNFACLVATLLLVDGTMQDADPDEYWIVLNVPMKFRQAAA